MLKHDKKSNAKGVDIVLLYEIGNPKVINLTFNEVIEVIQH
jgi:3-dehydroquinate synthetase